MEPQKEEEVPVKKDRSVSKKDRLKALKKKKMTPIAQKGDVNEEDNRAIELVLKGVNVLLVKSGLSANPHELTAMLGDDINILFKLSHHTVFRIQVQTLKLLF